MRRRKGDVQVTMFVGDQTVVMHVRVRDLVDRFTEVSGREAEVVDLTAWRLARGR